MQQYPYHKDKQQAFQAAQQSYEQARVEAGGLDRGGPAIGSQVKRLKEEVNEAFQQIENALENASEHQRVQLREFQGDLHSIMKEIEEME
ncbi:hypothetical protein V1498_11375 [Peribacillus sp. SCS-26]|uniref:hypothetical protein n=1 Tax=Paraperibacillus marinus TaxID=3115295 RepID=UPI00390647CE